MSTTTQTTTPPYVTARQSGTPTGATPGSAQNGPPTSKQKYGMDVIVSHASPEDAAYYHQHGHELGDVTADVNELINAMYLMPADQLKSLKAKLVAAGFLSAGNDNPQALSAAYENALVWASQSGKTPDEALAFLAKSGAFGTGSGGAARAPFSPVVASPTDIKAALDAYAPQTLGHALTEPEKAKLVALYQQIQTSAQKSNYDANISGGTSTAPPALDAFVQQQATALHPQDAVDYGNLLQARTFMNMIGNFQGSQG